jgi:hypothetical protein
VSERALLRPARRHFTTPAPTPTQGTARMADSSAGTSTTELGDRKPATDLAGETIGYLSVSRNGLYTPCLWVAPQ